MNVTLDLFPGLRHQTAALAAILQSALDSADPYTAVDKALSSFQTEIDFSSFQKVGLVSMGKAAIPMARAALNSAAGLIKSGVVVSKIVPENIHINLPGLKIIKGNHPIPGADSILAGEAIIRYVEGFNHLDAVLFLISGGASALVTHPVNAISLDDLKEINALLLSCGASINEFNAVRKHLDDIKGGGLAGYTSPAMCISLVLSDVPGNRLDVIASGPTVPDPSTFSEAMSVLTKYQLIEKVPESVLSFFKDGINGVVMETPKPGNPVFNGSRAMIIGSLEQTMQFARLAAQEQGYETEILSPQITGEARIQGIRLSEFLREQAMKRKPGDPPRCWITGGETTVTLSGNGSGGRNQELALAAVNSLDGLEGAVLLTFATDGEDGRSPAAGAVVTGATRKMAILKGMDPDTFLANHDSFTFFKALDAAIITGSTETNVNDLVIMLLD